MAALLEHYGLIGDTSTVALASRTGSMHRQLGNCPQAFAHVGLVNSAFLLQDLAAGRQPYPAAAIAA